MTSKSLSFYLSNSVSLFAFLLFCKLPLVVDSWGLVKQNDITSYIEYRLDESFTNDSSCVVSVDGHKDVAITHHHEEGKNIATGNHNREKMYCHGVSYFFLAKNNIIVIKYFVFLVNIHNIYFHHRSRFH